MVAVEGSVEEVAALRERVAALEERLSVLEAAPVKKVRAAGGAAAGAGGGRVKKVAVASAPLPEAAEGAPDASAYRIPESEIKEGVCLGRRFKDTEESRDQRWSPNVYRELQCGADPAEGEDDLCATCAARMALAAAVPTSKKWLGRVTEEPPEWCHMLGTEWAETKKPRWRGEGAADSGSEASSVSAASSGGAKPGRKPAQSAEEKEAAAAAKKAEKEAAAAAKKAEKEAVAAAKKAEKEAAAAAKKEAAAAAAAAKKAEKEAAKKPAAAGGAKKAAPAPAAAAAAPAETATVLKIIGGVVYRIIGSDAYEWDELANESGALVGRLEGETFIPVAAAEEEEEEDGDQAAE